MKKEADLLLLANEDSEEEGLKYKISNADYALLQQAKQAQGIEMLHAQLGF